jgi:hypothetical protein
MELKKVTRSKFKVTIEWPEFDREMLSWAETIFGTGGGRGTWRYGWGHWIKSQDSTHRFFFRREEDATMFMLRWANNGR